MSFTINQTGIEDYLTETTQIIFPHPPIVESRWAEGTPGTVVRWSVSNTPCVVQYQGEQDRRVLRLFVRTLTAAQIDTLRQLRDDGGLLNVKITPGSATTILCMFAEDTDQDWHPMIAEHPDAKGDASAIDGIFLIYEAHIVLARME